MSAPANTGRQSPDPERQTGAQQQNPPASDPNKQGMAEVRRTPSTLPTLIHTKPPVMVLRCRVKGLGDEAQC